MKKLAAAGLLLSCCLAAYFWVTQESLPTYERIDRIAFGAVKDVRIGGETTDPVLIGQIVSATNAFRARSWKRWAGAWGSDCIVQLNFYSGPTRVGLFAVGKTAVFTNPVAGGESVGDSLSFFQEIDPSAFAALRALLPEDQLLNHCRTNGRQ